MKDFIHWFAHFSMRGRNIPLFLGLYFMMVVLVMNWGGKQIAQKAGKSLDPLDLHFSYAPTQAYTLLGEYGAEGREFYALFEMTADVAYPMIYTLFLCTLIGYTWKSLIKGNFRFASLVFVPFLVLLADYAENICIVILLKNYPLQMDTLASLSSIFTTLKWLCFGICALIILVGLGKRVITHFAK